MRMIQIVGFVFSFFMLSVLAQSNPCKIDPERCSEDIRSTECSASDPDCSSTPVIRCAVPFTTENDSIKCELNSKTMLITCIVTGFDYIPPVNFQKLPSLHQLSLAFSFPCYSRADCAERFQCALICDSTMDLDCPTHSKK